MCNTKIQQTAQTADTLSINVFLDINKDIYLDSNIIVLSNDTEFQYFTQVIARDDRTTRT